MLPSPKQATQEPYAEGIVKQFIPWVKKLNERTAANGQNGKADGRDHWQEKRPVVFTVKMQESELRESD